MSRIAQFEINISRARELVGLGDAVSGLSAGRLDATDLYRSALVQGVATLDTYVHGVVLDRIVDILLGRIPAGSATKVGFHFGIVSDLLSASTSVERELRARSHVADRLALETFQRPDSISQAFAMAGIVRVWATAFGASAEGRKLRLSLIVRRRNNIVHSCDADPLNPGSFNAFDKADADSAIDDVSAIVRQLNTLV